MFTVVVWLLWLQSYCGLLWLHGYCGLLWLHSYCGLIWLHGYCGCIVTVAIGCSMCCSCSGENLCVCGFLYLVVCVCVRACVRACVRVCVLPFGKKCSHLKPLAATTIKLCVLPFVSVVVCVVGFEPLILCFSVARAWLQFQPLPPGDSAHLLPLHLREHRVQS